MNQTLASVRPIEILLVEDNPGDVRLTKEAFKEGRIRNCLAVVKDGVEALDYLRRQGSFAGVTRPDMILLDLNLPRKDGRAVLAEIKVDEALCGIPVVILSTSQNEDDITSSYDLHANCYISKPVDLERFLQVVHSIEEFWLGVAQLPTRGEQA
ncbi:MAG: Two-component system response regulator [Armatimonadetes bacterium]|jgi:CheY-like chemotaxis protein|nr:Two-component system response regulator [Armatimonadota bacterium]